MTSKKIYKKLHLKNTSPYKVLKKISSNDYVPEHLTKNEDVMASNRYNAHLSFV